MFGRTIIRRVLSVVAIGSTGVFSSAVGAQVSAATGVSALMHQQTNDPWHSATRLDPTVRLDGRWFQMTTAATVLGGSNRVRMDDASVDFLAAPTAFGPFRLTTTGRIERQSVSPVVQHTSGTIESALSMRVGNWGGWFGVAAEHTREIDSARVEPLARFGVWRQFNDVTVSVSRDAHSMFAGNQSLLGGRGDTLNRSGSRTPGWTTTEARVSWALKGVYFDTRFGIQPKVSTQPQAYWGSGSAIVPLNSRLSIVAAAGNQPAIAWVGAPAKRFASLGLRVAPAALIHPAAPANVRPNASTFALSPLGHEDYVVSMHVPSARAVEISGDFNGWKPVALREMRPNVWEATLTLRPGTYHMNVRVNGDSWTAPPGLPAANDDFNGTVGLVVVR